MLRRFGASALRGPLRESAQNISTSALTSKPDTQVTGLLFRNVPRSGHQLRKPAHAQGRERLPDLPRIIYCAQSAASVRASASAAS
jgi:hypothetical protein